LFNFFYQYNISRKISADDGDIALSRNVQFHAQTAREQEGQHPLTGQRAANFRLLANQ